MTEPRRLPPPIEAMIERARALRRWSAPSREIVSSVEHLPEQPVTPPVERTIAADDETPLDIRSAAASAPDGLLEELPTEAYLISRVFEGGEFAVAVHPPGGDGRWRFQGTLWLHEGMTTSTLVSLVHEDHVLASSTLPGSGNFEFDEYLGTNWTIEIHLGDDRTLVVEEPPR